MTDKVQKIRAEVERIQLYTQSKVLKQVLDYIDEVQKEPVSSIWHDASEPPIIDKTFLLVAPNGNSSLCLWGGKQLHSVTIGGGHSVLCKGDIYSYIDDLLNLDNSCNFRKNLQEEPVSDDLEEVIDTYLKSYWCGEKEKQEWPFLKKMAIYFAEWQKQKDSIPVSEDLEEASKNYALNNTPWDDCKDEIQESFKTGANWQKQKDESTTEDLDKYINKLSKQFPEVSFAKLSRIAVRVSRWQRNQDTKNKLPKVISRTDLDEYAYQCAYDMSNDWAIENPTWHDVEDACKLGANWQKEQFEKNRIAACDRQTGKEAEVETDFVMEIIEKEHRQPTFDDAIKYGMRLQKEQMKNTLEPDTPATAEEIKKMQDKRRYELQKKVKHEYNSQLQEQYDNGYDDGYKDAEKVAYEKVKQQVKDCDDKKSQKRE